MEHPRQSDGKEGPVIIGRMVSVSRELPQKTAGNASYADPPTSSRVTEEHRGNKVSCDNMGVLHIFTKKSKRVLASSSNADVKRVPREMNRRANNKYQVPPRACTRAPRQDKVIY